MGDYFLEGCTILQSPQQCVGRFQPLHIFFNICYYLYSILAILIVVNWYLIVVLICISLMTNDVEHLFMCLLVMYIYSLGECLFRFFANLKLGLFVFLLWNCKSYLYILDMSPLSDI